MVERDPWNKTIKLEMMKKEEWEPKNQRRWIPAHQRRLKGKGCRRISGEKYVGHWGMIEMCDLVYKGHFVDVLNSTCVRVVSY